MDDPKHPADLTRTEFLRGLLASVMDALDDARRNYDGATVATLTDRALAIRDALDDAARAPVRTGEGVLNPKTSVRVQMGERPIMAEDYRNALPVYNCAEPYRIVAFTVDDPRGAPTSLTIAVGDRRVRYVPGPEPTPWISDFNPERHVTGEAHPEVARFVLAARSNGPSNGVVLLAVSVNGPAIVLDEWDARTSRSPVGIAIAHMLDRNHLQIGDVDVFVADACRADMVNHGLRPKVLPRHSDSVVHRLRTLNGAFSAGRLLVSSSCVNLIADLQCVDVTGLVLAAAYALEGAGGTP